jgi:Family of unknown function (DUF6506)
MTSDITLQEGLILLEDGANPATDRIVRDNGRVRRVIVFVPEPTVAVEVATELADDGVERIELDGGFGPIWSAKIFEAVDGRAAVGCVMFGFESMDRVAAFKQRYEAQMR